mmetsp:Transcript_95583/g.247513  ORF Transcript_95583/g.247513 Transcript_95583/m.247513 type:complete len:430 (-) Transcript_95583:1425-2714(-)
MCIARNVIGLRAPACRGEFQGVHRRQDVQSLLIDLGLGHLASLEQARDLVVLVQKLLAGAGLLHVDVQAGLERLFGIMRGPPITNDQAVEVQVMAQELTKQPRILTRVDSIDLVVGAHDGCGASVDGGLKNRHVNLVLSPVVHGHAHRHPEDLLVVIEPVLHARHDALGLDGLHKGLDKRAPEKWILAGDRLEPPPSKARAHDLDIWPEQHVGALPIELVRHRAGVGRGDGGVEGRRDGEEARELRRGAGVRVVGVVALGTVVEAQLVPVEADPAGVAAAILGVALDQAQLLVLGQVAEHLLRLCHSCDPRPHRSGLRRRGLHNLSGSGGSTSDSSGLPGSHSGGRHCSAGSLRGRPRSGNAGRMRCCREGTSGLCGGDGGLLRCGADVAGGLRCSGGIRCGGRLLSHRVHICWRSWGRRRHLAKWLRR